MLTGSIRTWDTSRSVQGYEEIRRNGFGDAENPREFIITSILGPIIWLAVTNILLERSRIYGAWLIQAFADDVFAAERSPAVFRGSPTSWIQFSQWIINGRWNSAWSSAMPTNHTMVQHRGRLEYAPSMPIFMNGHQIIFEGRLTYFEATFDMHLSWMPHLDVVQEQVFKHLHKIDRVTASNCGIKLKLRPMLYAQFPQPIILYAASIWYTGGVLKTIRLLRVQQIYSCVYKVI